MAGAGAFLKQKFPSFLLVLAFTELWERYSFYSMTSIMTLYMVNEMGINDATAIRVTSLMTALGYLLPLISGYIADRFFGFKAMMFIGAIIVVLGHFILTFSAFLDIFFYWGVSIVSVGTGLFKGNITNLLGSCYDHLPKLDRVSGFTLFYSSINLGAFVAFLTTPYVAEFISYHIGFSLAGFGMIIGLAVFHLYRNLFVGKDTVNKPHLLSKTFVGPFGWPTLTFLISCILSIPITALYYFSDFMERINLLLWIAIIIGVLIIAIFFTLNSTRERKNYLVLVIYYFYVMVFWIPALQLTSTIIIFVDRNVYRYIGNFYLPGASIASVSGLIIMIMGLLLSSFYKHSEKLDLPRIGAGLFGNTICYFLFYIGTLNANPDTALTSLLYPLIGVALLSLGEVMISPLLQAITTAYAPKGKKGIMFGIYMAMLGLASLSGFMISNLFDVPTHAENNPFVSLEIYKQGFLTVTIGSSICCGIFIVLYPLVIWLRKPTSSEKEQIKSTKQIQIVK